MTDAEQKNSGRPRLRWLGAIPGSDWILFAVAVFCAGVYLWGQPRVNPESLARLRVSTPQAIATATAVLAENGVDVSGLRATVSRRRNAALLAEVQEGEGRRTLMRQNPDSLRDHLPTHFLSVRFTPQEGSIDGPAVEVWLTGGGKPWRMRVPQSGFEDVIVRGQAMNADAIAAVANIPRYALLAENDNNTVLADTTLARRLVFFQRIGLPSQADSTRPPPPREGTRFGIGASGPVVLGTDAAVAIARLHANRYNLSGWNLEVDSVWVPPGERTARVRLAATGDWGIRNETEIAVTPTGFLAELRTELDTDREDTASSLNVVAVILAVATFLILGIVLLVTFFRRLLARSIDVKAALIDGLAFSLMFVSFIVTARDVLDSGSSIWIRLLGIAAAVVAGGTAMSLLAFLISGAADSLARRGWAGKLLTTSLLRQGALLNGFVGTALLRGLAFGLVFLGVHTAFMWVFGDYPIVFDAQSLGGGMVRPFLGALGLAGLGAYVYTLIIVLTVASLLYGPRRKKWIPIVGVAIAFAISSVSPVAFDNAWLGWLSSLGVGSVAAFAFWRYDALTVFAALSSSALVWHLQDGWLMRGSPVWVDLVIAGVFFLVVVVVAVVGVARGRSVPGVDEYVPSYIRELRQQERMHRELEIAHQVQESFLPHEMPDVDHLDIAATCIAAEEVGGDYYDLVRLDEDHLALAIGDVSGKGIQAAFFMTLTKGFLRSLCREQSSPAEVLRRMNRLFIESAPRGVFISIVYGIINVRTGEFTFARAGHNPVILRRSDGESHHLQPNGIGIGLDRGIGFDNVMEESLVQLRSGDTLVFYTDGFSEARNAKHEEYGDRRLLERVASAAADTAHALLDEVYTDVDRFVAGAERHDDMTMLVVRFTGRQAAAGH